MRERTIPGTQRNSHSGPSPVSVGFVFVLAGVAFLILHHSDVAALWWEDLPVYAHAVRSWLAGRNPYNASMSPLFFLYPPVFLYMAGFLSHLLPSGWGEYAYAAVEIASACALPLVLVRVIRQAWMSPLLAMLVFFASPRFTGVLALCGMNIASILYCLAFLGALPGLKRNKWGWFYLAVLLAAMIKITFLALLLLPLLAGRRQWLRSMACGGAVVGVNLLEMALTPALYGGYEWSLKEGILAQQQFGYGVFGIVASYHHKLRTGAGMAAYAVAGVFALLVLAMMFLLRRRLEKASVDRASNGIWLALAVATVILVNPRQMQYDVDIALFAAFVLWVYALRTRRVLALLVGMFLPCVAVPLVVLNPHLHGMYETLLVLAGFGMGFWRLWREAGMEPVGARPLAESPVVASMLSEVQGA